MEDHSVEAVRLVYMRACRIHLPKKPYISLAWAAFEERHGMQIIPWTLATSFLLFYEFNCNFMVCTCTIVLFIICEITIVFILIFLL